MRNDQAQMEPQTFVIAAGGTAGHVVPALAVAGALQAEPGPQPRIVFIGGERAERELVPAAGFELRTITVEGLSRSNPLKAARALGQGRDGRPRGGGDAATSCSPPRCSAAAGTSRARSAWRRPAAGSRSC